MQHPTMVGVPLLASSLFLLAGCPAKKATADAGHVDAAVDSGAMCAGSPSGGCEEVVGSAGECPSWETVCAGVCSAAYDCCFCGKDEGSGEWHWQTLYTDCPLCPDAGVDAPIDAQPGADATVDATIDGSAMCAGSPSGGCEEVVGSEGECPSWETVCAGICGAASYDCCFCGKDEGSGEWHWQTLYIDCPLCPDAGG